MEFLKKFDNIVGINTSYVLKSGFWLVFYKIFSILLALILSVAFARLTTKEIYGSYQFFLSVLGFLAIFSLPGLNVAMAQSVARGYTNSLKDSLKLKLKWSILGSLLLVLFSLYLHYWRGSLIGGYFLLAAVFFPFLQMYQLLIYYYQGKKNFRGMFFYNTILNLIFVAGVVLALFMKLNLWVIISIYLVLFSIIPLFYYLKLKKGVKSKKKDPDMVNYGKSVTFMKALKLALENLDKIIVTYFLGFAMAAVYAVALSIPGSLRGILNLANPLFFSKAASGDEKDILVKIKSRVWLLFLLPVFVIILFWFLNPILIPFFFSENYNDAIIFSQYMLISLIFVLFVTMVNTVIFAKKKKKEIYFTSIMQFIIRIGTLLILVPSFGIFGAISSRIISQGAVSLYYGWFLIKNT